MRIGNIVIINVKKAVKREQKVGMEYMYLVFRILTGKNKQETHRIVRNWQGKWIQKELKKELKEGIR